LCLYSVQEQQVQQFSILAAFNIDLGTTLVREMHSVCLKHLMALSSYIEEIEIAFAVNQLVNVNCSMTATTSHGRLQCSSFPLFGAYIELLG
jgi:hypothetical protein